MDAVYNGGYSTTIILDNRITAMTGQQEHPGTGFTIKGEPTEAVDYGKLAQALGVKHIRLVDPYNVKETIEIIREEVNRDAASVIITQNSPCMLLRRANPLARFRHPFYSVDPDTCLGCRQCLEINCPAISYRPGEGVTKSGRKKKGTALINKDQCVGCGVCVQVCEFKAMYRNRSQGGAMHACDTTQNIFFSGVGGQGTILASSIMGHALLEAGFEVKKAEVHGMAQRGGSVTTHFRFGRKVYSPLIKQGDVDYLVSFELLEGLRELRAHVSAPLHARLRRLPLRELCLQPLACLLQRLLDPHLCGHLPDRLWRGVSMRRAAPPVATTNKETDMRSRLVWTACLALALASCSDDTTPAVNPESSVTLREAGLDAPAPGEGGQNDAPVKGEARLADLPPVKRDGEVVPADGALQKQCKPLETQYAAALKAAKVCNPLLTVVQCTVTVDDQLACPCLTHVDQSHQAEITLMANLKAQWQKLGCQQGVVCPNGPCPVTNGICTSSGGSTSGVCVDKP